MATINTSSKVASNESTFSDTIFERTCENCAKAREVGKNHKNATLYNCTPQNGINLIRHFSKNDCAMHRTFEEFYGVKF